MTNFQIQWQRPKGAQGSFEFPLLPSGVRIAEWLRGVSAQAVECTVYGTQSWTQNTNVEEVFSTQQPNPYGPKKTHLPRQNTGRKTTTSSKLLQALILFTLCRGLMTHSPPLWSYHSPHFKCTYSLWKVIGDESRALPTLGKCPTRAESPVSPFLLLILRQVLIDVPGWPLTWPWTQAHPASASEELGLYELRRLLCTQRTGSW